VVQDHGRHLPEPEQPGRRRAWSARRSVGVLTNEHAETTQRCAAKNSRARASTSSAPGAGIRAHHPVGQHGKRMAAREQHEPAGVLHDSSGSPR
jgi:hypothetical protein